MQIMIINKISFKGFQGYMVKKLFFCELERRNKITWKKKH